MKKLRTTKGIVLTAVALLVCGTGVAIALGAKDDPSGGVPVDSSQPIVSEESAPPEVLTEFSFLKSPEGPNLEGISAYDKQWIRYGLENIGGKEPAKLSAVGAMRTRAGSDVVALTASDKMCVFASKGFQFLNGTCNKISEAESGQVFVAGEYEGGPNFYVVGVVPDGVSSVSTDLKDRDAIELSGNVYEGVLAPKDFVLKGLAEDGSVVTEVSIPLGVYAKD
jgi:hypothetical protein